MQDDFEFIKPGRKVIETFCHHSADSNPAHDNISYINRVHSAHSYYDGFPGYHYFIQTTGNIQKGRPINMVPQAQALHNTGTIAICLHGVNGNFTNEQKDSLIRLCEMINDAYDGTMIFKGHSEINATLCPSYPYKEWLNLDDQGHIKKKIISSSTWRKFLAFFGVDK